MPSHDRKRLLKRGGIALATLVALIAATVIGVNFWRGDSQPSDLADAEEASGTQAVESEEAGEAGTGDNSEPASTPQEALQRDLDLSPDEAEAVFDEQAAAQQLRRELQESLGDSYGGSNYDIETSTLTVSVTDEEAVSTVEDAGAEANLVDYGVSELANAASGVESDDTASVYVDEVNDAVVVEVPEGSEETAEDVAAAAGIDPGMVRVEETTNEYVLYEDIIGGLEYTIDDAFVCSVGFAVTGPGGENGFATAGHCGEAGAQTATPDGVVEGSVFPGNDMAWVSTAGNWNTTNLVSRYDAGDTVEVAGSEEAAVGSAVCRSGRTTGWHCGVIQSTDSTVRYAEGRVEGLTRANACAEGGDSGGSWISGNQAQGVTSGGSGDCTNGGVTYFQPLNPILSEFGLSLVTEVGSADAEAQSGEADEDVEDDEDPAEDSADEEDADEGEEESSEYGSNTANG